MISKDTLNGHTVLWLENDRLRIAILPEKGADIASLVHKPTGVQFLMKTPAGLCPPGDNPPVDFLDNYEGGWQELFPNTNDGCEYRGRTFPFHGEVALLPWTYNCLQADTLASELLLQVRCRQAPFVLERRMRLDPGLAQVEIRERVTHVGVEPWEFVWGHHLTLGGDFLEAGCLLELPASSLQTPEVLYEPETARLSPDQCGRWPFARGRRAGEIFDLRQIPGPEARCHDDVLLGGLERGAYRVINPRLRLCFSLEWDASIFPWVMLWMPYGGAVLPPLTGTYGVGIEPWMARSPLAQAAALGQARSLAPGESLETTLTARIDPV